MFRYLGRCIPSAITNANCWWPTRNTITDATMPRVEREQEIPFGIWVDIKHIDLCKTENCCHRFSVRVNVLHLSHHSRSVDRRSFQWCMCGWPFASRDSKQIKKSNPVRQQMHRLQQLTNNKYTEKFSETHGYIKRCNNVWFSQIFPWIYLHGQWQLRRSNRMYSI